MLLMATGATAGAASPTVAGGIQRLAGTNVLLADRPSEQLVRLDRPASLKVDPVSFESPQVAVVGRGRIIGLNLHPVGQVAPVNAWTMIRSGHCYTQACVPSHPNTPNFGNGPPSGGSLSIAPGTYVLRVLTDGAPVKISFRLNGLTGSTVLRPGTAVPAWFVQPPAMAPFGNTGNTGELGASHALPRNGGLAFYMADLDVDASVEVVLTKCSYDTDSPPPGAFLPPCPESTTLMPVVVNGLIPTPYRVSNYGIDYPQAGTGGSVGWSYVVAGLAHPLRAVVAFTPFGNEAPPSECTLCSSTTPAHGRFVVGPGRLVRS